MHFRRINTLHKKSTSALRSCTLVILFCVLAMLSPGPMNLPLSSLPELLLVDREVRLWHNLPLKTSDLYKLSWGCFVPGICTEWPVTLSGKDSIR